MAPDLHSCTVLPCRFYTHEEAVNCTRYVSGTKLDQRIIRTDLDTGFAEGRQYGRSKSGGQVRDDYRMDFDEDRGGLGGGAIRMKRGGGGGTYGGRRQE